MVEDKPTMTVNVERIINLINPLTRPIQILNDIIAVTHTTPKLEEKVFENKSEFESMEFIETEYVESIPISFNRQNSVLKNRNLWQDENQLNNLPDFTYDADDEVEVDIKAESKPSKVILQDGVCSECKLSRKNEEDNKSRNCKCKQLQVTHQTAPTGY